MKILSNNSITRDDLNKVDEKQTRQIAQLRIAVAAAFLVNAALSVALFFLAR